MCQDVIDGLLDGGDLFSVFVRDFAFEFFFQRHHQFNGIQRIRTQIVDERRLILDFRFVYAQLLGNDLFNALFDRHLSLPPCCKLKKRTRLYQSCKKFQTESSKNRQTHSSTASIHLISIDLYRLPGTLKMHSTAYFQSSGGAILMISSAVVSPAAIFSAPLKRSGLMPSCRASALILERSASLPVSFFISALSGNIS